MMPSLLFPVICALGAHTGHVQWRWGVSSNDIQSDPPVVMMPRLSLWACGDVFGLA